LKARGHDVRKIRPFSISSCATAVLIDPTSDNRIAGADPRRDCYAIAYWMVFGSPPVLKELRAWGNARCAQPHAIRAQDGSHLGHPKLVCSSTLDMAAISTPRIGRRYARKFMSEKAKALFIEPMLLLRTEQLPHGPEWLHELKFDGYRALAIKNGGKV
jgi:hypothetical protein